MKISDPELAALAPMLRGGFKPVSPDQPFAAMKSHVAFADILDPSAAFLDGFVARKMYIHEYGFVVVSRELLDTLASLLADKRCLEVGAGSGFLSHFLSQRGVDIQASDLGGTCASNYGLSKVWQRDHEGNSLSLLPGAFDAVVLCWPPYNGSFGTDVLQAMAPGQLLFFEGEDQGGCTADDAFFDALATPSRWEPLRDWTEQLQEHHLHFTTIHDAWSVWRKVA